MGGPPRTRRPSDALRVPTMKRRKSRTNPLSRPRLHPKAKTKKP